MGSSRRSESTGRGYNPYYTPVRSGGRIVSYASPSPMTQLGMYAANRVLGPQAHLAARAIQSAYRGYRVYKQYQNYKKAKAANNAAKSYLSSRTHPKLKGISTGTYKGKFKKPTGSKKAKVETYYLSKGYHSTQEKYGDVSDPHCVYLGHSTFNAAQQAKTIVGAMYRRLLKKAGISIGSRNQEIPFFSEEDSRGFRITYTVRRETNGNINTYYYDCVDNETLKSLITNNTAVLNHITGVLSNNQFAYTDYWPYTMKLYAADKDSALGASDGWRLAASLNFGDEKLEIGMMSTMVVQNRTLGAGATTGDVDRVDNQPLSGYIYEFNNAVPKLRYVTASENALQTMTVNGTLKIAASNFDAALGLSEPPVPAKFGNLKKSSKVILQPGDMKKVSVSMKYVGVFKTILKDLQSDFSTTVGSDQVISKARGRSQVLCLEELMRTSTENPVVLSYEIEYKVGAILRPRKAVPLQTDFSYTGGT